MKIHPVGAELFYADGRTDTMELIVSHFSQFCERVQLGICATVYGLLLLDIEPSQLEAFVWSPCCKM